MGSLISFENIIEINEMERQMPLLYFSRLVICMHQLSMYIRKIVKKLNKA